MGSMDEAIEAVQNGMPVREASREFGVKRTTLRDHLARSEVPDGYMVKGTSSLVDAEGNLKLQWIKMTADAERQRELLMAAVEEMKADLPRLPPWPSPKETMADLCNTYILTDFHLGAMAWHREGGENWDLEIAEETLVRCFSHMMRGAPDSKVGIVCQLGDFLHSDGTGLMPVTPLSGNVLDQDGRFTKLVRVAIRVLRRVVDMALQKHEQVHVIMAEGNHDLASSIWLREMFSALYENDPRISVDTNELPYYTYQHGETALFFHHGHMKKPAGMTAMFAAQFPKVWGSTTHRYGHCGHMHHSHVKEDAGCTIHQHRTLAARDSFASRHGWFADRGAQCITYHVKHGQVASNNVTPEMI